MKKQTIRTLAAVFACAIVSAGMASTAFAAEETTTAVTTTTTALDTTTAPATTTVTTESTVPATTTILTDAPITQGEIMLSDDGISMYNDYLRLVADSNGKYTIGTTNGDPLSSTDNNKALIYGFAQPSSTSYVTIVADGTATEYKASGNGAFSTDGKNHVSSMAIGNLVVNQTLTFVPNNSTGREDVIEIRLDVKNNDTVAHTVGGRIMIDTMLGDNDSAPFRIPGTGAVTTETEYAGEDIPEYWQAFDSLTNPSVISQGSFLRNNTNPPDKVQFVNWGGIKQVPWDYTITSGRSNGDSAVSAIWNEETLEPGATVTFKTYYGLSELTQDLLPPLALSVYGDSTVDLNIPQDLANLLFTSYVENIGEGDATNAYVRITLPNGFTLAEGSEERIELDTITVNELKQSSWTIQIPTSFALGTYPITVSVGADGIDEKSVTRYVTLVNSGTTAPATAPAPTTTTTVTTTTTASTNKSTTSTAPKTGDAGVSGVAAALAASVAAAFAMKRRKNH